MDGGDGRPVIGNLHTRRRDHGIERQLRALDTLLRLDAALGKRIHDHQEAALPQQVLDQFLGQLHRPGGIDTQQLLQPAGDRLQQIGRLLFDQRRQHQMRSQAFVLLLLLLYVSLLALHSPLLLPHESIASSLPQLRPRLKYGDRLNVAELPAYLLKSSHTEAGYRTQVYQVRCRHKSFDRRLNVVILRKTHLESGRVGHVILFSSDLFLGAATLIDYYTLRFQIEFTFRDARQHFGLEDFMGVTQTSVGNAMGLSLFLVNLSHYLLGELRTRCAGAGIAGLKSGYRGRFYASFMLKLLPEKPEGLVWEHLVEQMGRLGCIHLALGDAPELEMAA